MNVPARWWLLAIGSHLGLLALVVAWHAWLAPPERMPVALVLLVFGIPLLLPLRGLLHGRVRTHGWSLFISLFYFVHGVLEAWAGTDVVRILGSAEIALALGWFAGSMFYIRTRASESRE